MRGDGRVIAGQSWRQMSSTVRALAWKLLALLGGAAALVLGIKRIPKQSPALLDDWIKEVIPAAQQWLVPVAFIVLGTFLVTVVLASLAFAWWDRRRQQRTVEEIGNLKVPNGGRPRPLSRYITCAINRPGDGADTPRIIFGKRSITTPEGTERAARSAAVKITGERPHSSDRVKPVQSG